MNERLKKIRKALDLTQQEFATRIGSKRNTIAKYETNTNTPSAAVISLICREFNVNENWLRTGNGDMFLSPDRHSAISRFLNQLLQEESSSFKNRLISILADLSIEEWEFLERRINQLYENKPVASGTNSPQSLEPTTAELEEEYKKSISSSAQRTSFTVSNTTGENKRTGTDI